MLYKCLICHKDIACSYILAKNRICKSCFSKLKIINKTIIIDGIKCLILYEYNEFMKSLIVNLKGYKDIELSSIFLDPFKSLLQLKYKNYIIVPIPSSKRQDKERGFNHVKEIFKVLNIPIIEMFKKKSEYKQSSQHKMGRLNIFNEIEYLNNNISPKTKVLLVDDITTTHSSLRVCIKLLREHKFSSISCLVVAGKK